MKNHSEKVRDMRRAALPSTKCMALDRRLIHHRERQAVRVALKRLDDDHDIAGDLVGPVMRTAIDLHEMILERRAYDHLAAVERWAAARVRNRPHLEADSLAGQIAHFRRLLGSTTIGLHALVHIAATLERPD